MSKHEFLSDQFLEAMNDIGRYGHEKYKEQSFHHRRQLGDNSRGELARTTSGAIAEHAAQHFSMYLLDDVHDHFGTRKHQLAAVAFNAMMECFFAGLENESVCVGCGKEGDGICENCESPLCFACDSKKYHDVMTCKDGHACVARIGERPTPEVKR